MSKSAESVVVPYVCMYVCMYVKVTEVMLEYTERIFSKKVVLKVFTALAQYITNMLRRNLLLV
jgi:hypothetical protein